MATIHWHRDAHDPSISRTALRVSSVRVEKTPTHWHIAVWNRGGRAGELSVLAADGPAFVTALLPPDAAGPVEEWPARNDTPVGAPRPDAPSTP